MPRMPRGDLQGTVFHVLNRGNARATVFHKAADYRAFINLLAIARHRFCVKLLAFCLMPNHFHAVTQTQTTGVLSQFLHWWLTTHVRRYHRHYGTTGHVWQGRFKSFPVQTDEHLLTVIRYVLRNPVRAALVRDPAEWPWSSLQHPELVDPWPVPTPSNWDDLLAAPLTAADLDALRRCVTRQAPFGEPHWQFNVTNTSGLAAQARPLGRPRKPT